MPLKEGAWCLGCGARPEEAARDGCKNPPWHIPDAIQAAEAREQERRKDEVRLPYADS